MLRRTATGKASLTCSLYVRRVVIRRNKRSPSRPGPGADMRSVALTVWFFLNVVLLGMCGYIYLLWLQYWRHISTRNGQQSVRELAYAQQDRRPQDEQQQQQQQQQQPYVEYYDETDAQTAGVRQSAPPPVPTIRVNEMPLDKTERIRLFNFKNKIIARLRQVVMKESSNYGNEDGGNPYGVPYRPQAAGGAKADWMCSMAAGVDEFRTLARDDVGHALAATVGHVPDAPLFGDDEAYGTCAIVSNAATLRDSNLGYIIDQHDLVLRFNNAPTKGYEKDVGSKTTIRILNSQVVTKPQFNFLTSPLYKRLKLLMWDPSNYTSSVEQWIQNPEHKFVNNYISFRKENPKSNFHIVHPQYLWRLWDFIQDHTTARIRRNPPSSGFLGLAMLLPRCTVVNMFEFIPSERMTHRCHYYHEKVDVTCTFGIWHPLAAEKLLMLAANTVSDQTVFRTGFVSVPGYKSRVCVS